MIEPRGIVQVDVLITPCHNRFEAMEKLWTEGDHAQAGLMTLSSIKP
jgi:hypothetical protein